MRQSTSQRKNKIELTCRLSAEKLRTSGGNTNLVVTPPRMSHKPILMVDEEAVLVTTVSYDQEKTQQKKGRRKTSNLQINIECIEDEYAKKTALKAPIYQDTPLFASVAKLPVKDAKRSSVVEMQPVLHETTLKSDSRQARSRMLTEESTTRLLELSKESEKYSYDNLIEAIKIHHRQESDQLSIDKERRNSSPLRMRDISQQQEQKRNIPNASPLLKAIREEPPCETAYGTNSCNVSNELLKRQFRRAKLQVLALKDVLKVNAKMTQIKLLMDALEKQLCVELTESSCSPPKPPAQPSKKQPCESTEIENSQHFQSIHQKFGSKELPLAANIASQSNLRKFNTEHDEPKHCALKNSSTKSPFREIMNYMSKRR